MPHEQVDQHPEKLLECEDDQNLKFTRLKSPVTIIFNIEMDQDWVRAQIPNPNFLKVNQQGEAF